MRNTHCYLATACYLAAALLTAGTLAAEPRLEIRTTDNFKQTWNDSGSGADDDVALYRPLAEAGWFIVGDYAQGNYDPPTGASYLVRPRRGGEVLLMPPVGYRPVWTDAGSGADRDGSVWQPVPQNGYVCLGFVSNGSHAQPSIPNYRCVREDVVTRGQLGAMIWKDSGSGADDDLSIWMINDSHGKPTNTFTANDRHSPPGGAVYTLEGLLAERPAKPSESAQDKLRQLTAHAPRVWLAPGEEFFPSSVEWASPYLTRFLNPDDGQYWLRTKQALNSPSDDSLPVFKGHLASAPVYAFWVKKGEHVDLVYFFYYPYNRGKSILDTIWGNHVGDWEHITVRLEWVFRGGAWSRQPSQVYIAAHNFGGAYRWKDVTHEGTHPVVYSARGSHGSWKDPGEHEYKDLGPLGDLVDICGAGTAWDTWQRVEAFDFGAKQGLGGSTWPRWMSDKFANSGAGPDPSDPGNGPIYRWGNTKEGCGFEGVSGECRLNNGPSGPISKDVWDPNTFE